MLSISRSPRSFVMLGDPPRLLKDSRIGPLKYTSPNAPKKADVMGAFPLSVLAGQKHYCHITAIRADDVVTELLGMEKIPSEDSVRRAFLQVGEAESSAWLTRHLIASRSLEAFPGLGDTERDQPPVNWFPRLTSSRTGLIKEVVEILHIVKFS